MFESIQKAYEILLPLVEGGNSIRVFTTENPTTLHTTNDESSSGIFPKRQTQLQAMSLIIQTQAMICRRYEKDMSRLKYPAYSILVCCISQPSMSNISNSKSIFDFEFARAYRAKFILLAVELIFRTCLISPLNSEELIIENGVPALASLIDFYIKVVGSNESEPKKGVNDVVSNDISLGIVHYSVRTLAGVAFYENGREAIKLLQERSDFLVNWRRCIALPAVVNLDELNIRRYALEGIVNMANDQLLQEGLIGSGIIWPIIRYTMMFDSTLEESPTDASDIDDLGYSVAACNLTARLAVRALGVLSGLYGDGPQHGELTDLLGILLTQPIARMLRNKRTDTILKVLNSNVERADIIWNVQMRKQLETFVMQKEKNRPESLCQSLIEELGDCSVFVYDLLKQELQIGGIYVRHFNKEGKDALVFVERPINFFESITSFIAASFNRSPPIMTWVEIDIVEESPNTEKITYSSLSDTEFLVAMNTFRILCFTEGLLDDALCQSPCIIPHVILSFLELPQNSEVCLSETTLCRTNQIHRN
jgi:hypothetical protein